jgi:hypothetical protein
MGNKNLDEGAIPFEVFAGFKRIKQGNPILSLRPPEWAAATHAIIQDETVHYIWCKRVVGARWLIMHAIPSLCLLRKVSMTRVSSILSLS